jgi:hypothetical protein
MPVLHWNELPPLAASAGSALSDSMRGGFATDLLYGAPPVTDGGSLNFVTASHALALIHALTSWTPSLKTSVPGPFGLPGGWPVRVDKGKMRLDLPDGLSVDAGVHCQSEAAKFDGIEGIAADGTVTFTESARSFLRLVSHELAAPMHPDEACHVSRECGSFSANRGHPRV